MTWTQQTYQAGEWRITPLSDGFFRLDGGSMWGVVPANLWRKLTPPEEDNTIALAARPFLLERGEGADRQVVVLEPGIGDRWEPKWKGIYHMLREDTLQSTLAACGVAPEDVTHVFATHCHWDHIGAMVVEREGKLVPLFPNAQHRFPSIEVDMTRAPGHARKASYRSEDIDAVIDADLLEAFDATAADGDEGVLLLPGLRMHTLGGHSDGSSLLTINAEGEGDTAVFWGDVVPTSHHIQPAFIMAYDIDVVRSFEQRSKWLSRAAMGGWLSLYYHDEHFAAGRISKPERRYVSTPEEASA
ncbi:MAG: MBL fold metallo-hydrolase [Planctomycetota bacterium]|jgi:glyoxylase-like metal-dependent hydrolase (beta-lactamase superfamily II)|nr:MBL fold metallo-hydrolase [Planctomycetota bacterium]